MKKIFPFFNLNKKITTLAPMDGYTDCAFREITKKYSNPDLIFTEFVSARGLISAPEKLIDTLRYTEFQRPIIAQIFGKEPEYFYKAAVTLCQLGFDGIDINMGCPAKNVASHGGGAALIKNPKLAVEIITSVKKARDDYLRGAIEYFVPKSLIEKKLKEWGVKAIRKREITVSLKTRIGYDENGQMAKWLEWLEKAAPDFITLHGRTFKQGFKGKADWEMIEKAAKLVDIPVIGNGDLSKYTNIQRYKLKTNCAGVMIGRGFVGKPFLLNPKLEIRNPKNIVLEHAELYKKFKGEKRFYEMRKILVQYFKGFKNVTNLRKQLVQVKRVDELKSILYNKNINI